MKFSHSASDPLKLTVSSVTFWNTLAPMVNTVPGSVSVFRDRQLENA